MRQLPVFPTQNCWAENKITVFYYLFLHFPCVRSPCISLSIFNVWSDINHLEFVFFMEYELRSTARSDQIFNTLYALYGRIQDFVLGGTKVGEGSGDCLRSPSGPGQNRGRGPRGIPPGAPGFWVFRKLFRQQFCSILWMWWNVLKRMNLLQKVSNSF